MRINLAFSLAILLSATSAYAAERSFPVSAFERIDLEGSADVDVRTGLAASVLASGDEEQLERLDIRVEDGLLRIGQKRGSWGWDRGRGKVRIAVTTGALSSATLSGSGNISVDRLSGAFSARLSGAGDMALPKVEASTLALAISGSGTMKAAGSCAEATVRVSGSGNIDAAALQCRAIRVAVTGSGNVNAQATGTADLAITGSGNIEVAGGARCTTRTTGTGTTRCG